jgi:hypothetical protein
MEHQLHRNRESEIVRTVLNKLSETVKSGFLFKFGVEMEVLIKPD